MNTLVRLDKGITGIFHQAFLKSKMGDSIIRESIDNLCDKRTVTGLAGIIQFVNIINQLPVLVVDFPESVKS